MSGSPLESFMIYESSKLGPEHLLSTIDSGFF